MTLAEYFQQNPHETKSGFAERIGVSPTFVTYLTQGQKKPGLDVAEAIERETGGAVRPQDFYDSPGTGDRKIDDQAQPSEPTPKGKLVVGVGELVRDGA